MEERHEREQYFFTPETTTRLADFAARFPTPCCLCTPSVGALLGERGVSVRVLDIDERFASARGFLRYDLYRPHRLDEQFGLILCDPPFAKVSLAQLFTAVRTLSQGRYGQPLLISYPRQRAVNLQGTFARFGLVPTGYCPRYQTVKALGPSDIEFFGNLPPELHAELAQR
jgi:hypothetical protein